MPEDLETRRALVAAHEAGHAAMRWVRGLSATRVWIADDGRGYCEGTGRPSRAEDEILVGLAGFAVESEFGLAEVDWTSALVLTDVAETLSLLRQAWFLYAYRVGADGAITFEPDPVCRLRRAWGHTCGLLCPHAGLVDRIAWSLEEHGALSARQVAAIGREYARALRAHGGPDDNETPTRQP